jgi:cytochrome b pre-mRNA-processing protein 3
MLLKWLRRASPSDTIEVIYGAIVAQARLPAFYAECGVPDTVEGRFDMIVLHLFLLLRRLNGGSAEQRRLAQALMERFCSDLDANLREMGVGDLTVPKKMQKFAEAFYGRSAAYEHALLAGDRNAASAAIARNVFAQDFPSLGARYLADYMFEAGAALANATDDAIGQARFAFPAWTAKGENSVSPA